MVVCRCPFVAGSRSGWAFSSAFRVILTYNWMSSVCCNNTYSNRIHTVTLKHRNCSGSQATWKGPAGWESWMWCDGEQRPNYSRRTTSVVVLQVQGYFLITPSCPLGQVKPWQWESMFQGWWRCGGGHENAQGSITLCSLAEGQCEEEAWFALSNDSPGKALVTHRDVSLMMAGGWRHLKPIPHPENSPCLLGSSLSVHRGCWSLLVMKTQGLSSQNENNKAKRMSQCLLSSPWLFWAVADCVKEPHSSRKPKTVYVRGEKNAPVKD